MSGIGAEGGLSAAHAQDPLLAEKERTIDDVPASVRDAALRAFALRDRAAEVLELTRDSLFDDQPHSGSRLLLFTGPGVAILVTVTEDGPDVAVEVAPEGCDADRVELQSDEQTVDLSASADGRWAIGGVRHGLISLVAHCGDRRLRTSWLRV